jgi:hypothetical protein
VAYEKHRSDVKKTSKSEFLFYTHTLCKCKIMRLSNKKTIQGITYNRKISLYLEKATQGIHGQRISEIISTLRYKKENQLNINLKVH